MCSSAMMPIGALSDLPTMVIWTLGAGRTTFQWIASSWPTWIWTSPWGWLSPRGGVGFQAKAPHGPCSCWGHLGSPGVSDALFMKGSAGCVGMSV